MGEHLADSRHHFKEENGNGLDKENKWFQRGVKEALQITVNKQPHSQSGLRVPLFTLRSTNNSLINSQCREFAEGGTP